MRLKECVAMILAGGQGSRLGILTQNVAKPAVPFGGKYRIIDFPLSNCSHSGIDTVGVLTQYQPLELNTYIANGQPWDLDRTNGGVFVLPPYTSAEKGEWYKGTANAIYQNLGFMEQFNPKYVIILSGDHIYKMDYNKMLSVHKKANADATIAVIEVPWDEAPRFGIMNTSDDMQLILCYYNRYSYMRVGDLPLEDIVNNYKGYGLPCFETIRRARQRVQSLFPELSRQCSGCDCGNIRIVIEVS